MQSTSAPPDGFELARDDSPFVEIVGPVYRKLTDEGPRYAFRTEPRHGNRMGSLFGGFAMAFVDAASTFTLRHTIDAEGIYAFLSMTSNFIAPIPIDEWIEVAVDVKRGGTQMAFLHATVRCRGKEALTSSIIVKMRLKP